MKECIYCKHPLEVVRDLPNYYACTNCFDKHLMAVLYSYDSWGDRFTSVYLDYYSKLKHIRVGIQPFLEKAHVVVLSKNENNEYLDSRDRLVIYIEGSMLHEMLHPHFALKNHVEFTIPLTTMLTPQNVEEKIGIYLLFS